MPQAGPTAFMRNPNVFVRLLEIDAAGPSRIIVSAYSAMRGFMETLLDRSDPSAFAAVLALARGEDILDRLSPDIALTLWGSGLIILPPERLPAFAAERFAAAPEDFAANHFALVPDCLTPAMVAILAAYYREQVESGAAPLSKSDVDRRSLHNDPAARVVQQALLPAVAALVGAAVKSSYTYASLYREGAVLPVHVDRSQCEYTLSLLIDHQPSPADGISPWAIEIYPQAGAQPIACLQSLGGGILFRGRKLPHGRQPLPAGQSCWTLLLHYVDADFDGPLD